MVTATRPFRPQREKRANFGLLRWLLTGKFNTWYFMVREREPEDIWAEHRDAAVQHHIRREPGSRPLLWWRYSAPEPRQRLGGTGTPSSPEFIYGVPRYWRFAGDHLSGGVVLSESDPPTYEAEASYLRRLGLLLPGELRRIPRDDFNPVVIRRRDRRIGVYHARVH
jgi:hypothetical protein